MPRDTIQLDGVEFDVANGKNGERLWRTTSRASQPGDPGDLVVAEWRVDGPDLFSFEQIPPGAVAGYLGRDRGEGTDGRWEGLDTLGPLLNVVTLSTHDQSEGGSIPGTATFIPGSTLIPGPARVVSAAEGIAQIPGSGTTYGYVIRGTTPTKVDLSDMSVELSGEALAEPATSVISTRSADGTQEIAVGMATEPYRVVTAVGPNGTLDTWAENDAAAVQRIFGKATDRIVGLAGQQAQGNILTGSITMFSPNWQTVATRIGDEVLIMTGFALDGRLWVVGTSNGPYILDQAAGDFFPVIEAIDNDDDNCLQMTTWFILGVVIPLKDGLRFQKGGGGASFGPELFTGNTSPVQGQPTGFTETTKWGYVMLYDAENDDSYLMAARPNSGRDNHAFPISYYTLAKLSGIESRFLQSIGTVNGQRTNPTIVGGHDGNLFWFTVGRNAREIDDANYAYAASGTTFLTELRRQPGILKDIEAVEWEGDGTMDANKTVTVGVSLDGGSAQTFAAVTTTGFNRQLAVSGSAPDTAFHGGRRLKPQIAYATDASASAPQVVGTLRLFYRLRSLTVKVTHLTLWLRDGGSHNAEELEEALLTAERDSGPVQVEDLDQDSPYVRVQVSQIREIEDRGGDDTSPRGSVRAADVVLTAWQVA